MVERLGLELHSYTLVTVADERGLALPRYEAEIEDGQPIIVLGAEGAPLLGTAVLADHALRVDFTSGGRVRVSALPARSN